MILRNSWMGFLAVAVLCMLLTACSGETPPETTAAATTAPAVTTVPSEAPVETTVPVETTIPVQTTAPAETTAPTTAPVQTNPSETTAPANVQEPADDAFVRVVDYIPGVIVDLKYATADNICGKAVYDFTDAYLRYGTVKKLAAVQKELEALGYSLKIWDAYRPATAQFEIWQACHDSMYVTNPQRGYSAHCRGSNVDVTIVDKDGKELVMPAGFDQFDAMADRDYSDCSAEAAKNAQFLDDIMTKHGFKGHYLEWWQYTDTTDYDIELEFLCKDD